VRGRAGERRQPGLMMPLLRIWLLLTTALLIGLALWAFAPMLVFLVLLTAALGIVSAVMIALAKTLHAWRQRRGGSG
jgi:hypothetical protein